MQQLESTQAYLDALSLELCFDAPLARRVCAEVRGHFEDALTASQGARSEAQIIERFGDPRAVAAGFAPILARRQRAGAGVALGLALAAVFAFMEARVAWMPSGGGSWISRNAAAAALAADRVDFVIAFFAAVFFWFALYVLRTERENAILSSLPSVSLGCLAISVIADAVVALASVSPANVFASSFWAIGSVALELAAVAYSLRRLSRVAQRLDRLAGLSSRQSLN